VLLLFIAPVYKIRRMAVGSKSFPQDFPPDIRISLRPTEESFTPQSAQPAAARLLVTEVAIGFGLIEATLWSKSGFYNGLFLILSAFAILFFTFRRGFSREELGLIPKKTGTAPILLLGLAMASTVVGGAIALGLPIPADPSWPPPHAIAGYAVWALVQQFILQAFFFVRLESLLGGNKAVILTSLLFAVTHWPNPILTLGTLLGSLFFCEAFRRYRNLIPLGVVHAALGVALAESIPDGLLHHMRVGISYWHP
jgi:membrane protease YdiL (CAAX protease family)